MRESLPDAARLGREGLAPRAGPLPGWLRPLGVLAAPLYRWEVARRNRAFDAGRGVVALDRAVISVGNLSVGGTGKTPMVAEIVRLLQEMGRRPCVAMRGYGARAGARSDEEDSYLRRLPGTPIVARPDRVEALLEFFHAEASQREAAGEGSPEAGGEIPRAVDAVDTIVLDDGFQHRRLARQLDVVMIDCSRDPFADRLLPLGWLREPVESLSRAQVVVLTHAGAAGPGGARQIERRVREVSPQARVIEGEHQWESLEWHGLGEGDASERPIGALRGLRAMVCCAIGNPGRFVAMVERFTGVPLAGVMALRDHDPFEPRTIGRVLEEARRSGAQIVVTTDKDWSKLRFVRPEAWPCGVAVPRLALAISEPHRAVLRDELIRALARSNAGE